MTGTRGGLAGDVRVIGLIGAAHMMSHMFMFMLPPLFIRLQAAHGVSYLELGILAAAFPVGTAISRPGWVSSSTARAGGHP